MSRELEMLRDALESRRGDSRLPGRKGRGMKDCPWCHIDPNEIAALKQRVAELERELAGARGVTQADSARLRAAERRVYDDPDLTFGCDAADHMADMVLELRQHNAELERGLEAAIGDRDAAQDAIQQTHIALGGDGEWVFRMPAPHAPESGNLLLDVPALAKEMAEELATMSKELEAARKVYEAATRWWDTATVAHDAGVEYRVKGDAESRLRAVAADAAHADTIVGLGEAIEAYRATKEPRDEKAE